MWAGVFRLLDSLPAEEPAAAREATEAELEAAERAGAGAGAGGTRKSKVLEHRVEAVGRGTWELTLGDDR